ncbi:FtsK/SpoIIIE domain-containing protein [Frigoribacterium sp. 2-23]|uniref:FtsK/SpoIIIE domain-containing protein n=1 Tax=Frigoribacterium sp. 2-23 TaxID=3415006 RepID=UPI003C6FA069
MTLRLSLRPATTERSAETAVVESYLLDVSDDTSVAEVAESMGVAPHVIAPAVDPDTSLIDAKVLNGQTLPPTTPTTLLPGQPRLEIIGGPFAGETVPLSAGVPLRIGSGGDMGLCIADPYLAAHHVTLTLQAADVADPSRRGPLAASLGVVEGAEGVAVNGEPLTGDGRIVPADVVQLGSSIVRIGLEPFSDADLAPDEVGMRGFNRTSRIAPAKQPPIVTLPGDKPDDADKTPLPWLSAVIPVILGVTMAIVFKRPVMLMMAAASPVMVIGTFLTARSRSKKKGIRTFDEWQQDIADSRTRIGQLVREQRLESWYAHPDPVVVRDIATRPLSRLWERRKKDVDALHVRVGVTEVPLDASFEGGAQRDRATARHVGVAPSPVAVDLAAGVVGLAGAPDATRSAVRAMIASFATLRSPRDAQIVVLCDDDDADQWSWLQWLPHTQAGSSVVAMVGNTDDARRERLRELNALATARLRAAGDRGSAGFDSTVVVIVDGARRFRMLPGMVPLLESGGLADVHVIAIDSDRSRLPEESRTVVVVDPDDHSLARLESDRAYYANVLLDGLSLPRAEAIARSLCSIKHVSGVGDEGMLPTSVRYTELMGVDLDDPQALVDRWALSPRRTNVVVGAGPDSQFAIDIAADGPHALVAGTTGSGKSEFLQTWVVSLALANRPDALNFVLVDYKGASAFEDCSRLPHTVGMVTNLDARETERALQSLDAELKRRETVLRRPELGVKDVDAAWSKDPEAAARLGLARLMIVIDEFAELKTEHPDFINGLVRIARVGRSLGVHLVLATQRPSGVITPEMQSNINMRVALRVTDRADSTDVLGSPEASLIGVATPGRGYVRAGVGAAPAGFQTARVAGVRQGAHRTRKVLPARASLEWRTVGYQPRFPAQASTAARVDQDDTDLRALVDLVTEASRLLGVPKNPSPWLLPLPTLLPLSTVVSSDPAAPAAAAAADGTGVSPNPAELVIGLEDVPGQQTQRPLVWDLESGSHLLFLGSALSGRTTALRTLLAQAVRGHDAADLQLYVVDYGNGGLLPLAIAPHTGAVVTSLEPSRLPRLMSRLLDELGRRQSVLSAASVGTIVEQRRRAVTAGSEALPYLILALDGWERVTSTMQADELVMFRDQMTRVLREGPAVGLRVVMSADRTAAGDRVAGFISSQYVLPLRDINDYRGAGVMIREMPENIPPGRVLFGPTAREAQVAVLGRDASAEVQAQALRDIVEEARARFDAEPRDPAAPRPFRVDALPTSMTLSAAAELPRAAWSRTDSPTVGVGGDVLSRYTIDWPTIGGFSVIGDRGTGRSSALTSIAHQLMWEGRPVIVVATRESPLSAWARTAEVPLFASAVAPSVAEDVEAMLARFDGAAGAGAGAGAGVGAEVGAAGVVTVVIDDAEAIRDSALEQTLMLHRGRIAFVVALSPDAASKLFAGPYGEVRKTQEGLILSPASALLGTQLFGQKIPKFMVGRAPAGGGALHSGGRWAQIQVPDVTR